MGAHEDIKAGLDMNQIAGLLGTDEQTAESAVDQALSSLVSQMSGNVDDESGATALARALGGHVNSDAFGEQIDTTVVDTADGEAIVSHVYGNQIQQFGGGAGGDLLRRLLPILAPIVMAYLAKRLEGYARGGAQGGGAQQPQSQGGGGLGDILGDLFGGGRGSQTQSQPQGGGGLGDSLGDLLGGGAAAPTQEQTRHPAPADAPTRGPFNTPTRDDGDLRMDDSAPAGSPSQSAPAGGAGGGGLLGQILKEMLGGR